MSEPTLPATLATVAGALGTVAVLLAKAVYVRARRKNGHDPMERRVSAIEERLHRQANYQQGTAAKLAVAENDIAHVKSDMREIKDTLIRMDAKLDRALER